MADTNRSYLPAAGHDWALPFYDPLVKLMGGSRTRRTLIDQAVIRLHQRVLEIGCGTGTLVVTIKQLFPDVDVVGLDPDAKALARARRKAQRANAPIRLDRGFSDALPYPDASFDRVFSSFMFHHLPRDEKQPTLREARRVLKPGGALHLLDFSPGGGPHDGPLVRLLHSNHHLRGNSEDHVLTLFREAGFTNARKVKEDTMVFGLTRTSYYSATA